MKKSVFLGFFFYFIITMLLMGWMKLFHSTLVLFSGEEVYFWVTHIVGLAIWCGIGGYNDWFHSRD